MPRTVTLTAQWPGYDPHVHRALHAAWLETARREEYQTGWLPDFIAARITGVGVVQGQPIVRIEMAGGVLYDAYRRITLARRPKSDAPRGVDGIGCPPGMGTDTDTRCKRRD